MTTASADRHEDPIDEMGPPTQGETPAWGGSSWFTLGWIVLLVTAGLAVAASWEDLELALSLERWFR